MSRKTVLFTILFMFLFFWTMPVLAQESVLVGEDDEESASIFKEGIGWDLGRQQPCCRSIFCGESISMRVLMPRPPRPSV